MYAMCYNKAYRNTVCLLVQEVFTSSVHCPTLQVRKPIEVLFVGRLARRPNKAREMCYYSVKRKTTYLKRFGGNAWERPWERLWERCRRFLFRNRTALRERKRTSACAPLPLARSRLAFLLLSTAGQYDKKPY